MVIYKRQRQNEELLWSFKRNTIENPLLSLEANEKLIFKTTNLVHNYKIAHTK
jgi:hypothetical protein